MTADLEFLKNLILKCRNTDEDVEIIHIDIDDNNVIIVTTNGDSEEDDKLFWKHVISTEEISNKELGEITNGDI